MINNVTLVGRIVDNPRTMRDEKGNSREVMKIETVRPFRDNDGNYGTDEFDVELWNGISAQVKDYYSVGKLVGLKGRLENGAYYDVEGNLRGKIHIIAEQMIFLPGS